MTLILCMRNSCESLSSFSTEEIKDETLLLWILFCFEFYFLLLSFFICLFFFFIGLFTKQSSIAKEYVSMRFNLDCQASVLPYSLIGFLILVRNACRADDVSL